MFVNVVLAQTLEHLYLSTSEKSSNMFDINMKENKIYLNNWQFYIGSKP